MSMDEVTQLREQVARLHAALKPQCPFILPPGVRLTHMQARLVQAILSVPHPASTEWLFTVLYGNKKTPPKSNKVVAVMIRTIREKLSPYGVTITSQVGIGYSLDISSRKKLFGKEDW